MRTTLTWIMIIELWLLNSINLWMWFANTGDMSLQVEFVGYGFVLGLYLLSKRGYDWNLGRLEKVTR